MSEPAPAAHLLRLVLPALVVGIVSSLTLLLVSWIAAQVQWLLWTAAPQLLGVAGTSSIWIVLILTLTGVTAGLVVWKVPGHAGPDPATMSLVDAPLPLPVLPGLLLALILTLAGGVSLGPENPIMALNTGLLFAVGGRLLPTLGAPGWVALSSAGMIGAMFGTPVGAALALSEATAAGSDRPLWDRLFAPLVAAGAGAITTDVLAGPSFSVSVPPYPGWSSLDLVTGGAIGAAAALVGLVATYAFHWAHPVFHRIGNPVVMLTAGGVLLGVLGVIGGPVTLFKGLDEMQQLTADAAAYSAAALAVIVVVKLAALVIAATCGFRGGRIFPAVFVGVALGLLASALAPAVPESLAVACGVLGMVMAVTRQGWLSLFMAAVVVPDARLVPLLCLVTLPAWLLVTGRRPMLIATDDRPAA